MRKSRSVVILMIAGMLGLCMLLPGAADEQAKYKPTWESLKEYPIPEWLRDDKFGIWTCWGIYSVPAYGQNGTWYPYHIYFDEDSEHRKHHEKTHGPIEEFGYKDFIPMFTAEKFDADEWAELFQKAGAKFAGPIAEFHDGFAMWPTKYSEWHSVNMGPKRDVVGEFEKAVKRRGMRFCTMFHHAANWMFFPVWDTRYDCGDPEYSDLYGVIHDEDERYPNQEFLDEWYGKLVEVVDTYDPDLIWFDFGLGMIREDMRQKFIAYYYNKAQERGKQVVVTYKSHNLPPGVGIRDYELGQERRLAYHEWVTDTALDDQGAWCYVKDAKFKPVDRLVDNLVDRVSKNGYLLLCVGPRPDGTIPEEGKKRLLGLGEWLEVNGEAIYGTRAWLAYGEGPTTLDKDANRYGFNESDIKYTAEDIRFTAKDNVLYAICLDWPGDVVTITTLVGEDNRDVAFFPEEIESIRMLGDGKDLDWKMTDKGLVIACPDKKPCEHAFVFKIVRRNPDS
jgi:alpha-L-fucosidase